jgi:hypothetical protein
MIRALSVNRIDRRCIQIEEADRVLGIPVDNLFDLCILLGLSFFLGEQGVLVFLLRLFLRGALSCALCIGFTRWVWLWLSQ